MNKSVVVTIVVAAALLAGGGALLVVSKNSSQKSDQTNQMSNMDMSQSSTSQPSSSSSTSSTTVAIQDFAYSPAKLTVKKGTTITWTNKDSAQHTVTVDSGTGPSSQPLNQGDTYSYTFTTMGTFAYHCAFHGSMHATVTVTE